MKICKITKKVENSKKSVVTSFQCAQHPKAGQNTQQTSHALTNLEPKKHNYKGCGVSGSF